MLPPFPPWAGKNAGWLTCQNARLGAGNPAALVLLVVVPLVVVVVPGGVYTTGSEPAVCPTCTGASGGLGSVHGDGRTGLEGANRDMVGTYYAGVMACKPGPLWGSLCAGIVSAAGCAGSPMGLIAAIPASLESSL